MRNDILPSGDYRRLRNGRLVAAEIPQLIRARRCGLVLVRLVANVGKLERRFPISGAIRSGIALLI